MVKDPIKQNLYRNTNDELHYQSWWSVEDDSEVYNHMIQMVKVIDENQKSRAWNDLQHGKLYHVRLFGS